MSRILVDVDGVLRDLIGGSCKYLNGKNKTRLTESNFIHYELSRVLSPEELADWKVWAYGGGYLHLKWYRGAKEFLFWLKGHVDVAALTAAVEDRGATEDFLRGYIDDVLFALPHNKPNYTGLALIEDRLETLKEWVEANPTGLGVLVDRPWNREPIEHSRIVRCESYADIKRLLQTSVLMKVSA